MVACSESQIAPNDFDANVESLLLTEFDSEIEAVIRILKYFGKDPNDSGFRMPPLPFLANLVCALRLMNWESQGFSFHRDAGVPSSKEVMRRAVHSLID